MERWPNFFIVGADKAGTSSLYAYLDEIPGIFMSKIKEPNYFSIKTIPENHPLKPIRYKKKYLNLFKNVKDEKIIGESSPSYLADPESPRLIYQVSPKAKILISLRDPVERLYSNYLMLSRIGYVTLSFQEELQNSLKNIKNNTEDRLALDNGLYYGYVQRYISVFGEKQVKIIIFEEFIENPKKTLEEILNFLNIKYSVRDYKHEIYNKYGIVRGPLAKKILKNMILRRISEKLISPSNRRYLKEKLILKIVPKPEMNENDRKILTNYYIQDVEKIKNLLGRETPWKNFVKS